MLRWCRPSVASPARASRNATGQSAGSGEVSARSAGQRPRQQPEDAVAAPEVDQHGADRRGRLPTATSQAYTPPGGEVCFCPGIHTIDASAADTILLGHSHFASRLSVVEELFYLLTQGLGSDERAGLRWQRHRDGDYRLFLPASR
jgi:hypothetical protein